MGCHAQMMFTHLNMLAVYRSSQVFKKLVYFFNVLIKYLTLIIISLSNVRFSTSFVVISW